MAGVSGVDVATIVRLVAIAADPTTNANLEARRSCLMAAIGEAISADIWMWVAGSASELCELAMNSSATQSLGAGWSTDEERHRIISAFNHCTLHNILWTFPVNGSAVKVGCTRLGAQLNADALPQPALQDAWRRANICDLIISAYPLSAEKYSVACYCRRVGGVCFTERDCAVVHNAFQHVPWLHASALPRLVASSTAQLSPREREVLQLLLEGHARKEVAVRMNLSTHTIADYLKIIYKKLGVTSRGELLAKFIPGQ